MNDALPSEIGFLNIGLIKSSNITPVIELRPVDIELFSSNSNTIYQFSHIITFNIHINTLP